MADAPTGSGRIVTFYSYKGGTGRSMGLANVAWLMALSGFKVLVIDWDLEAPGLHRYFRPFLEDQDLSASDGLIDFVIHFAEAASEQTGDAPPADWYKPYSNLLRYAIQLDYDFPGDGTLDFIPAGRQNPAYAVRVNSFNWKHFYEKLNGERVLEEARRIMREEYDYVLIDSRTGVSDTAGICTVQMPDDLVVCFTLNLQSVLGASAAAASVVEQRRLQPIRVFPIAMRVEPNEKLKTSIMKAFAKPKFLALLPAAMTEEQKDKYWGESDVPYIPFYAFEENLAYFRDEVNSKTSVLAAMRLIAGHLAGAEITDLPRLDPQVRAETVAAYDAFSVTKVAGAKSEQPKTAVYISSDSDEAVADLRSALQDSGLEALARGGGDDEVARQENLKRSVRRASAFLIVIGESGLTSLQREELLYVERVRSVSGGSRIPIWNVLLPGAQPETLPRLLLPYGVLDLRDGGDPGARTVALLDSATKEPLDHLPVGPYPGLNPFTQDDRPMFSGRNALVDRLAEAVAQFSLVALIGPPRSGKKSIIQAGLIPRLKGQFGWDVRLDLPTPYSPVPAALSNPYVRVLLVVNVPVLAAYVTQIRKATGEVIYSTQAGWNLSPGSYPIHSVLIVAETAEQVSFCEFTLTERNLAAVATRIEVPPLSEAELAAAITEPAFRAGLQVDPALAKRIAADLRDEPVQLPLLQYVLAQLWAREPRGILTMAKYEAMGGVRLVEQQCEAVFASLSADYQMRCLRALTRLIFVPDAGPATPQSATEASLSPADPVALQLFLSAGILAQEREQSSQTDSWRFSDRIFLERWPRLQTLVDQNREFLRWRQGLDRNLSAWQSNRRTFTLLNGEQLAEAQRQAAQHPGELNQQECDYIGASSGNLSSDVQQISAAQTQRKRSSYGWAAAGALAVLASGAYLYISQQHEAQYQGLVRAAQQLSSRGDFEEALAQYQKAASVRPDDSLVAKETGSVYASLGQPVDAMRAFDKAVRLGTTDIDTLAQRGDIYAQLGSIQAAQKDWLSVLAAVPGDQHTKQDLIQIAAKTPGRITVILYTHGIADPTERELLIGNLQKAGFLVQQRPYGLTQPPNVLWYAGIPAEQWRKAAQLAIQAGVALRETKQAEIGAFNIQIGYSANALSRPPITPEDLGDQAGPSPATKEIPARGWCYQETASPATARLDRYRSNANVERLTSGYGAYCHTVQQDCEKAVSGSRTASPCVFVDKLDMKSWGGTPSRGYLGSWYRVNLAGPIPPPFPQPPSGTVPSQRTQNGKK